MQPTFYTVLSINGDYADLISDDGKDLMITLFLLPDGTDIGSRLKYEVFQWSLVE